MSVEQFDAAGVAVSRTTLAASRAGAAECQASTSLSANAEAGADSRALFSLDGGGVMASLETGSKKLRVAMLGLGLGTTTGIARVVNNWLSAGYAERVELRYISTNDSQVPGQRLRKASQAGTAYLRLLAVLAHVDVVHLHLAMEGSFWRKQLPFWLSKLCGRPVIVHLHDGRAQDWYAAGGPIRRYLLRRMFEAADANVVLARTFETWVKGICHTEPEVFVVPNAALPRTAYSRRDRPCCTITVMGRLEHRKGTWDMINAFAELAPRFPNLRLCLAGDGDIERARRLVRARRLEERVQLPGWVAGHEQDAIWYATDIYALPSYHEGLPGSVLEAMAAGLPVVASRVGGIPEAVVDGVTGLLVDPGNVSALVERLERLVLDEDLRLRMGAAGRARQAEYFAPAAAVGAVVEVQERVGLRRSR